MRVLQKNSGVAMQLLAYFALSIVLLLLIDIAVSGSVEQARVFRLQRQVSGGTAPIMADIRRGNLRLQDIAAQVEQLKGQSLPDVNDIEDLADKYTLRLDRMERRQAGADGSATARYTLGFRGTMGGLTRFLRDLETSYVCDVYSLGLRPHNEDGSRIAMTLVLAVKD